MTQPETQSSPDEPGRPAVAATVPPAGGGDGLAPAPILRPATADRPDPDQLRQLRAFHLGRSKPSVRVDPGAYLPALTWAYRDPGRVRSSYPLLLIPSADDTSMAAAFRPLPAALDELVPASLALLRDNLPRLEQLVREQLRDAEGPCAAPSALRTAAARLVGRLRLRGKAEEQLLAEVARFEENLPAHSQLLPLRHDSPLLLLRHVSLQLQRQRREAFRGALAQLAAQLRSLVAIDRHKTPEARSAATLDKSMGPASRFVDPAALAGVVGPARGTTAMSPERRRRVETALARLEQGIADTMPLLCILSDDPTVRVEPHRSTECQAEDTADAPTRAIERFDELAGQHLDLYRALRVAQLELHGPHGCYDAAVHAPLLAALDWSSLTTEELQQLPVVVAVTSDAGQANAAMGGISRLLLSRRPITALAGVAPSAAPQLGQSGGGPTAAPRSDRLDLGYLALGHRQARVSQSSAVVPEHFVDNLRRALDGTAPTLILAPRRDLAAAPRIGDELYLAAAVESRAHPLFCYDPQGGQSWARRFDLAANPDAEQDWSTERLRCQQATGDAAHDGSAELDLSFTFADFCLLHPQLAGYYQPLPPSCAGSDALLSVSAYLELAPEDTGAHIPFVWGVNSATGQLEQLVVMRDLVLACRERLDLWRTLQELAGIRSEYVERALAQERQLSADQLSQRLTQLQQQHDATLAQVRQQAASEVLGRLAESLVGLAPSGGTAAFSASGEDAPAALGRTDARPAAAIENPAAQDAALEQAKSENPAEDRAEDDAPEEPWIDSALCTSCNDCMGINAQLFVYNSNKQAEISSPDAGSYADLVAAAEKCPARCIHPGTPLNPNEPELDQLLERARKFA